MQITALDHIQLAMPTGQEEKARHFYTTILGFCEVAKPDQLATRGGCWFERDGIHVHLGVMTNFTPATKAHPGFRVANLKQAQETFINAGISIQSDHTLPHVRRFYVNDPFGNRIEIIQDGDLFSRT